MIALVFRCMTVLCIVPAVGTLVDTFIIAPTLHPWQALSPVESGMFASTFVIVAGICEFAAMSVRDTARQLAEAPQQAE